MDHPVFAITFQYALDDSSFIVRLTAEVEWHPGPSFYLVKNFRSPHQREGTILPAVEIKRDKGQWIHCDSEKESLISRIVGQAIDEKESSAKDAGQFPLFAHTDSG